MEEKYLTVGAITRYLKAKFESDDNLRYVFLKGEISNFKHHTSGHLYFSVKDETSKINAVMFSRNAGGLDFHPEDGTKVLIQGRISVYETTGNYQIYVEKMVEDGIGNLYVAFEKLKKKLQTEGLFEDSHKKKLIKYPKKVGVVTASTGAAVRDIITTIKRRYPICEIVLFPSLVQGDGAKDSLVYNIKTAANYNLDVLIVGRGGGSIEDLWPFNEEEVARVIYDCPIPIISAVGHEVDFTICDFVADLRAPTPTAAAELAVPNLIEVENYLKQLCIRLQESIMKKVNLQKLYLESIKGTYTLKNPLIMFENKKQNLDLKRVKITDLITNKLSKTKDNLKHLKQSFVLNNPQKLYKDKALDLQHVAEKLELLNPITILNRGYAVTYNKHKIIKTVKDIKINDNIDIRVNDGFIMATVTGTKKTD